MSAFSPQAMRRAAGVVSLAALGLMCAATSAQTTNPTPCDARAPQSLLGQANTAAIGEDARRRAGAQQLRVLKPGEMATMDFVDTRLNLELDAQGRIRVLRCG